MQNIIHDDTEAEELARLREQVIDLGESVATLTGRARTAERRIDALLGMLHDACEEKRLDAVCEVIGRAYRAEGMIPPPELGVTAPARPPLTVLRGGGAR